MNSNQNYYEIFGISETATLREIKDAYKKKAMEFHPDVNPNKESCHEMMCLINQIYFILRNPVSRAQYDQTLKKIKLIKLGQFLVRILKKEHQKEELKLILIILHIIMNLLQLMKKQTIMILMIITMKNKKNL